MQGSLQYILRFNIKMVCRFVKEKKILTLEEAVNKMTGRTAEYN